MRKIFLSVAALFVFGAATAQDDGGFSLGIHVGVPAGDSSDFSSLNYGLDAAYMFPVAPNFTLGIASGYTVFAGKDYDFGGIEVKGDDFGYIPLAAAGRYGITENIFLGADLGYAFYSGDRDLNGGMYYQGKLGYDFNPFEIFISYKGIGDDESIGAFGIGAAYKF